MRDFDWGNRVTHVLGEIIEAFIILLAVAVMAGVVFLLVRYLLVATRAAQLYVDQHEPPRNDPRPGGGAGPTNPASPAVETATTTPTPATDVATAAEATFLEPPSPTAQTIPSDAAPLGDVTEKLPPATAKTAPETAVTTPLTKPLTKPATKPRKPKNPPSQ